MAYDWIQVSSPLAYSASSATVLQGLRGSELTNSKGVVPVMCPSHNSLLSLLCTLQVLLNGWKLLELWVACWSSDKLHYHILHKHGFVCQWWCSTLNRFGYQKFNREDYKDIQCSLCLQFVFYVECEDIYLGSPMMLSMLAYIMDIMARHAAMWFTGFNGVPNIILHSHLWFFDAKSMTVGTRVSFQKWTLPLSSFEFVCLGKHITSHLQKPMTSDHFVSDGGHTVMQFPPDYFYWEGERLLWYEINYNTHKHMCASENARNCKMVCCLKPI